MFPPCFSAADAVAVTSPARGVLTLGFVDLAVISALRALGEQVPLNLACLLEDPMVTQGSDLLLLLRFGHRAAEAKLRAAHLALRECLCGGLCSQTRRSLSPPAQCANSVQKHMSLLSEPPLWSLSCLLCLARSHSTLGWPRCSRAPYFAPEARPREHLVLGCPPKPADIPEHSSSELCGEQGQRPGEQLCRGLSSLERGLRSRGQQHQSPVHPVSRGSPNSASAGSGSAWPSF